MTSSDEMFMEIKQASEIVVIDGVTINLSLIAIDGKNDFIEQVAKIGSIDNPNVPV